MCYRLTCKTCGKITWGGCGAHVESALRGVPEEERCQCREEKTSKTPAVSSAAKVNKENWS